MRSALIKLVVFVSLTSCANINFILDEGLDFDFLKNKTSVHLSGWDNNVLKELFFLRFGETSNKKFILNAKVSQKQTKRSVDKSQVAKKLIIK